MSARAAIQANEERLLARLDREDRAAFLRATRTLSRLSRTEIIGEV